MILYNIKFVGDAENLEEADQELGTRNKREAEELEPFEYVADFNGEFEGAPRFKRDLFEEDPDEDAFESRKKRDLEEQNDDNEEEAAAPRSKRSSVIYTGDVLSANGQKMPEWVENGTHRINQYTKLAYLLTNDIPAKIVYNVFQNSTHKINLVNNEVYTVPPNHYSLTSSVTMGYQVVTWFYAGMIKTDTFRDLIKPIPNPVYNSSIQYTAPNYTSLSRNDTSPQYTQQIKMPEWVFNGTHLIGTYNRMVEKIQNPENGVLISNWYYNASHQIDFVNNKVYAFDSSHSSPMKTANQVVVWFIPSNGFIKTDTFRDLKEPISEVAFNLSEIYFDGTNFTSIYKNVSYARKKEWAYNGTHLTNVMNGRLSYYVPSPVSAVLVNNVYNNITHQTDFLAKKTYPIRNDMGGKIYQTISWYFNGLIRVDTLRNLEEPVIDPVFDIETIYFEDPNSTYIYKNESRPPATYVPPNLVPEWLFNGTHVNNVMQRTFLPIADPNAQEIVGNWFYNATHKVDLLNRKTYSTDVKPSSTTPRTGYQVVNCRFKGVIRTDTYKDLYEPISDPSCNLKVIYSKSPNYTAFYVDEKVSILPVKQPEWSFNGTHNINTYTNVAYPVDNIKPPPPKEEWIFNGTHKVNLLTKETYPKEPEKPLPIQEEWIFNGTHRVNTYTKKAYPVDSVAPPPPKDEWIWNGTHKVNMITKESYPKEPEKPLPVKEEWIFNGTHKVNTYTKQAYPVDTIAPPPPKDEWIFNGTHKVNLRTNEAYSSDYQKPIAPPKNDWVFNGTHKVNYATSEAFAVDQPPLPDHTRPKTEPGKPDHQDEWIFNGTHKFKVRTKEAYKLDNENPIATPDEWVFNGTHKVNHATGVAYVVDQPRLPDYTKPPKEQWNEPEKPGQKNEWIFNGTHKVNYYTKEAYPVG